MWLIWGLVTVAQALQMATSVPAKSVGLENTCGSLKVGLPADFIVLDDSLDLQATYVDGQKVGKNKRISSTFLMKVRF